jgi:hypothetical protein
MGKAVERRKAKNRQISRKKSAFGRPIPRSGDVGEDEQALCSPIHHVSKTNDPGDHLRPC